MQHENLAFLDIAGSESLTRWLALNGSQILLWAIGATLVTRFIEWIADKIVNRLDRGFEHSDNIVRSETDKHRHALVQVASYVAIALVWVVAVYYMLRAIGLPISGLAAPATVLGAGLGFGAQRMVQDFLAGFFIIAEKQYGFGDYVELTVSGNPDPAVGTVEDVTLRMTKLRSSEGEVISISNGSIIKATNLSKDWARAVVDIELPIGVDINKVHDILVEIGRKSKNDPQIGPLLLDEPTPMGVTKMDMESITVRVVARTLPGKQFEVGQYMRVVIVRELKRNGISTTGSDSGDSGVTATAIGAPLETDDSPEGADAGDHTDSATGETTRKRETNGNRETTAGEVRK